MFGGDQESCAIRGAPNEALERERGLKREKGLKRIWRALWFSNCVPRNPVSPVEAPLAPLGKSACGSR